MLFSSMCSPFSQSCKIFEAHFSMIVRSAPPSGFVLVDILAINSENNFLDLPLEEHRTFSVVISAESTTKFFSWAISLDKVRKKVLPQP